MKKEEIHKYATRGKTKIEQITANRELRRNTLSKDSIAKNNPAYIATEHEVSTSIQKNFMVSTHTTSLDARRSIRHYHCVISVTQHKC